MTDKEISEIALNWSIEILQKMIKNQDNENEKFMLSGYLEGKLLELLGKSPIKHVDKIL